MYLSTNPIIYVHLSINRLDFLFITNDSLLCMPSDFWLDAISFDFT